jgi:diguanylate cyclase (GGDEF)-like protein
MTTLVVSAVIGVVLLCGAAGFFLRRSVRQKEELRRLAGELARLREQAGRLDVDLLTGLRNRSALDRWLEEQPLCDGLMVVCDLDDFRALNESFGHLVGDEVLRGVGQLIRSSIRPDDRAFRWGGDEFVIFFRNLDRGVAEARLGEIEERLGRFQIRHHGPMALRFSWGLAATPGRPLAECLEEADRLMFEAKRRRRGQGANGAFNRG